MGEGGCREESEGYLTCYEITESYWDPKYSKRGREENPPTAQTPEIPER